MKTTSAIPLRRSLAVMALLLAVLVMALASSPPPAQAQTQTEVWSATLPVRALVSGFNGCLNTLAHGLCSSTSNLTDDDFTHASTDYEIVTLLVRSPARLELEFDTDIATGSENLILDVAGTEFAFEDADGKGVASRSWNSSGLSWSAGDTIAVKLLETSANNEPTGLPTITGTAQVGQTLTANTSGIGDADGLGTFSYQWIRGAATDIAGATASTYQPVAADIGQTLKVRVSWTDAAGTAESLDSAPTAVVTAAAPNGEVWSATLTVRDLVSSILGCSNSVALDECSKTSILSDDDFTHASTDYEIDQLFVRANGQLQIEFDTTIATGSENLILDVAGTEFAFDDADVKGGPYRQWNDSGLSWSVGDTIAVKLLETIANNPPTSEDKTVTVGGSNYTFSASDFPFEDADGDTLDSVTLVTLPTAGILDLDRTELTIVGLPIDASDLSNLTFTPASVDSGTGYASFTFKVNDGTADSASAYTMTIDARAAVPVQVEFIQTAVTVEEGQQVPLQARVTSSNRPTLNVFVALLLEAGTATDADYVLPFLSIRIAFSPHDFTENGTGDWVATENAGNSLRIVDDAAEEDAETFQVSISALQTVGTTSSVLAAFGPPHHRDHPRQRRAVGPGGADEPAHDDGPRARSAAGLGRGRRRGQLPVPGPGSRRGLERVDGPDRDRQRHLDICARAGPGLCERLPGAGGELDRHGCRLGDFGGHHRQPVLDRRDRRDGLHRGRGHRGDGERGGHQLCQCHGLSLLGAPVPGAGCLRPGRGAVQRRDEVTHVRGLPGQQDGDLRDRRRQRGRGRRRGDLHAGARFGRQHAASLRHLGRDAALGAGDGGRQRRAGDSAHGAVRLVQCEQDRAGRIS